MPPGAAQAVPHALRAALEALDARDLGEARRVLQDLLRALDEGGGGAE
jgi:hypothetical protein